mmetsp:Transcript_163899/g.398296  ORF Transcript_163899/g.398296 Transcript_163899/m.398296 type:complete len:552 (-) Transcript_163899:1084-2739(-)
MASGWPQILSARPWKTYHQKVAAARMARRRCTEPRPNVERAGRRVPLPSPSAPLRRLGRAPGTRPELHSGGLAHDARWDGPSSRLGARAGRRAGRGRHAPDDLGVLGDRAVRGELGHARGRLDAEAGPLGLVRVGLVDPVLRLDVGGEVVDEEVAVAVPSAGGRDVAELVHETAELLVRPVVAERELAAPDAVEDALHARVGRVVAALGPLLDARNLRLEAAEDEHRVLPALLADLDVGAVHGADDEAAVHHELHVRGAAGLRAGGGDVLGDVGRGDDVLRHAHAVVGHERDLQVGGDVGVVVHNLADVADELDDGLGVDVGGSGLASDERDPLLELGPLAGRGLLDHQVAVDDVEAVHQLALVLVDALELAIKQRVNVRVHVHVLLQVCRQLHLGLALRGHPLLVQGRVVLLLLHGLQQLHVGQPLLRAQVLRVDVAQGPVGAMDPPAGGYPVGHVHEFVLLALVAEVAVEGGKRLLFHNLRVERRHAVDFVAAEHCDVPHADSLHAPRVRVRLLEEAQLLDLRAIPIHLRHLLHEAPIDLPYNLQVSRQ